MNGKGSRDKGARWERDVQAFMAEQWPAAHRTRTPGYQADRGDIGGTPYVVECKDQAVVKLPEWWRQTLEAAERSDGTPLLIVKRKGFTNVADAFFITDGATFMDGQS